MPFEEDDQPSELAKRVGLKKLNSQEVISNKKTTQKDFDKNVNQIVEKQNSYKVQAAELSKKFKEMINDRTLQVNKNIFMNEIENELLSNMIKLAVDINNDPNEEEGMGSLMWVILLFKTSLWQRNKINELEYSNSLIEKSIKKNSELIANIILSLEKS